MRKFWVTTLIILVLLIGQVGQICASDLLQLGMLVSYAAEVENTENLLFPEKINDQDIQTQPELKNSQEYIYFQLNDEYELNLVKIYLAKRMGCSFSLEYLNKDQIWYTVDGFSFINDNQLVDGWNRFNIVMDNPVTQLRLRIDKGWNNENDIGISEIEFWADSVIQEFTKTKEYQMVEETTIKFKGGSGPKKKSDHDSVTESIHIIIDDPVSYVKKAELIYDAFDLESIDEGYWQINDGGFHFLSSNGEKHNWKTISELIDPTLLVQGENKITFKPGDTKKNGFEITDVKLRLYFETGEQLIKMVEGVEGNQHLLVNMIDGNLKSCWESDWWIYDQYSFTLHLAEIINIEGISWHQDSEFVDSIRIEYLSAAGWKLFVPELTEDDLLTGWNVAETVQSVETDQIRFTIFNPQNKQMIGPIYEVKVWGSKLKSYLTEPEITITVPAENAEVKNHTLVKGYIKGAYDQVKVNGKKISVVNNYFEQEIKLEKEKKNKKSEDGNDFVRTIRVEAFLNGEIVGEEEIEVILKPLPSVAITSPLDGFLTDADGVSIQGETDSPANDLYINGDWFSTGSRNFQEHYILSEGINQITVAVQDKRGLANSDTIYVYRDQESPVIYFKEDYNNQVLGEVLEFYSVQGYIEDYSACQLFANEDEVILEDEYFSYPAYLIPGYNYYTFKAIDELDHESVIEICLIQDSTPPNSFAIGVDPEGWSQITRPVISFSTTDDQTGINHYELKIDDNGYVNVESPYTLSELEDGVHNIFVKAVDNVGLSTVETTEVFVDISCPESFTPVAEPAEWSQITQPIISFATIDKNSGVNHYELKIDDGEYLTVESPYTLPKLEDGVHTIYIKVVDNVGLSTIETVKVYVDTTCPESFVPVAEPAEWSQITQPVISFATIDEHSGINHYELKIDDGEYLTVESPYTLPELADGVHTVSIKAVDNVGLSTVATIKVYVDTSSPERFIPVADPADWSQNTQPVISFETTDEFSGISHYELKIDDGEYVIVESPYTLPELEDGVHTIYVKAVDKVGLSTVETVEVFVDTGSPESFTPIADPAEWSQLTQPVVSFETIDVHSGINHYELKVDDGEYVIVESPYTLPELADGVHTVSIKAVDNVGLDIVETVEVFVDTSCPNEFIPLADPADWSQNTQPVISFTTTDQFSGIDHYELQIDDGDFSVATSPYTLPELADGVYDITVKAVDRVGLFTVGKTKVYVDTTPPNTPENYEVNPGDGEVVVKWTANDEWDLAEYRLYRQPVWNEGDVKVFEPTEEPEFVDQEVQNDNDYSYYLVAVDHVGNVSVKTETITKKVGIAKVEIDPANGGEVEYGQEVVINIPAEATEEEETVQVTVVPNEEIPEITAPVVSKTYNFDLIDQNGEAKEANFMKEISIEIAYDEELIPDGYSELDLDIYYYNELDGLWILMPKETIDTINNKVVINSTHFSQYTVLVTENYSPSVAEYQDLGISPHNDYFKNNQEYVTPASGSLNINTVDVSLPGRNGFDLNLGRIYSSSNAVMDVLGDSSYSVFGNGWRWNIAKIERNNRGEFIYLEDGTMIKCEWEEGVESNGYRENTFEYHEGHHLIAIKKQKKGFLGLVWDPLGYEIYFKDGRKYEFNSSGYLLTMIDYTGQNPISFTYNGVKLSTIKDTIGRTITFNYNDQLVSEILVNGQRFASYHYKDGRLSSATDRVGRITKYDYEEYLFKTGYYQTYTIKINFSNPDIPDSSEKVTKNRVKERNVAMLSQISYPSGGVSKYTYTVLDHTIRDSIHEREFGEEGGERYTVKYDGHQTLHIPDKFTVNNHTQYLSSAEAQAINPVKYSFIYDDTEEEKIIGSAIEQLYKRIELDFTDGLNVEKRTYDIKSNSDGVLIAKNCYDYNEQKAVIKEEVYHGSKTNSSYFQRYEYDNWGNLTYRFNSESGAEYYYHYLNTDSEKNSNFVEFDQIQQPVNSKIYNLLADEYVLNYDEVNSKDTPQQVHFHYDTQGNLTVIGRYHNNSWIKTQSDYDDYGNVIRITDPLNNQTDSIYDSVHNTFLIKMVKTVGEDTDGVIQPEVVTQFGYDQLLGLKIWEINPVGALTEYGYDQLGRLIWIKYPDESDSYSGVIGSLESSYYQNRADNPIKLQIYDDANNIASVANIVLNNRMIETSYQEVVTEINRIQGTISESSILTVHNLSRYLYDGLDRWIELKQYLRADELKTIDGEVQSSPFITKFVYNQVGNRIKEIDAEGYVTFKEYDGLNRLTDIYYPDGEKLKESATASNNHLQISYDLEENKRTIIDPAGNKSEEIKDWNGQVIEVAKYNGNERYTSHVVYDKRGNQIRVVDGEGRKYDFIYNDLNQLVKEILPETEVIMPGTGSLVSYRAKQSYEYDDLGRKTAVIMPNGNATAKIGDHRVDYVYDALGRVTKVIQNKYDDNLITKNYYDPAGRLIKTVDPEGRSAQSIFNSRGWLVAEIDPLERIQYHQYDLIGKEVAITDPRGVVLDAEADFTGTTVEILEKTYRLNPEFTTKVEYNSLSRQVKTIDLMGNSTEVEYDRVGNQRVLIQTPGTDDPESKPRTTSYEYTPQYWVKSVTSGNSSDLRYKVEYEYDKVGNKVKEIFPDVQGFALGSNSYQYNYDDLGRLTDIIRPDGSQESYGYDRVGNRTSVTNGRNYLTQYWYNSLNQLTEVIEPTGYHTFYQYDPNGNLVRKEMANGLTVGYNYNDLNLLTEEVKIRAGDVMSRKMVYDGTGNLVASSDARGALTALSYYEDGQIKEQVYYLPEVENYQIVDLSQITPENVPTGYVEDERIAYHYDEVGRLTDINDGLGSLHYDYTKLNQIAREIRVTEGNIYATEYGYDFVGNLTRMKYPESDEWVTYQYNELDQLKNISREVEGVKTNILNNLNYDPAGNLIMMDYNNNVETFLIPDIMSRVESITVSKTGLLNPLMNFNYGYDVNGNVVRRNENIYTYDVLDRLKTAEVDGTFLVDTPAKMGYVDHDYFINENLDYELANIEVDFDYAASTIGLRLDKTQKVGRVEIIPNEIVDHRVEKSGIRLFYRQNVGEDFSEITPEDWAFKKDLSGKIVITFKNAITAWEIKIHSNHDERDIVTGDVVNNAELSGSLQEMVRVYGRYERTQISYEYDAVGNRIEERYTDVSNEYSITYSYNYYAGSNRLKERASNGAPDFTGLNGSYLDGIFRIGQNEKMVYEYDKAGNMVAKGNSYTFSGENAVFNGSEGSIHWEYNYNGRNRLNEVIKSGEKVASYGYDYSGKRLKVDEGGKLTYFVYNYLGQMIYEDQETDQKQISYYYGLGRIIAKSEKGNGVQDGEEIYYYHHDNLGSTMLITDGAGEVVFEQEYAPFGQDLYKAGTYEKPDQSVEAGYKYTGQKEDTLTGLYYYNARYYDPEISRFITEDSYQGELSNPQSQNLYIYVVQNPMKYVDPSGNIPNLAAEDGGGATSDDINEFEEYWDNVPKPEEFFDDFDKTTSQRYHDKLLKWGKDFENTAALLDEWFAGHSKTPTGYWWNNGYINDDAKDFEFIGGGVRVIGNLAIFEGKMDLIKINPKHLDKTILEVYNTDTFLIISTNQGFSTSNVTEFLNQLNNRLNSNSIRINDLINHKPLALTSLKKAFGSSGSVSLIGISKETGSAPILLKDYIETTHTSLNIGVNILFFRCSLDYSEKLEVMGVGGAWKFAPFSVDINNTKKMTQWIIPVLQGE